MWFLCENVNQDVEFEEDEMLKKILVCLFLLVYLKY